LERRNGFGTVTDEHHARTGGIEEPADVWEEEVVSRRTFVSIAALVSLVNAIPGLIAPVAVASLYGATVDRESALLAQFLASSYIGYAVINWTTRQTTDATVRRGIDIANFMAWAMSAVIWIYAASTGVTNAAGWFGASLTLVFTFGWAYFTYADRPVSSRVVTATRRA
jgi:hypothetical protein